MRQRRDQRWLGSEFWQSAMLGGRCALVLGGRIGSVTSRVIVMRVPGVEGRGQIVEFCPGAELQRPAQAATDHEKDTNVLQNAERASRVITLSRFDAKRQHDQYQAATDYIRPRNFIARQVRTACFDGYVHAKSFLNPLPKRG